MGNGLKNLAVNCANIPSIGMITSTLLRVSLSQDKPQSVMRNLKNVRSTFEWLLANQAYL